MKKSSFVYLSLLLGFSSFITSTQAAMLPAYGADSRIQYFNYSPNEVFVIKTRVGFSSLIQLEADELINEETGALGMGSSKNWSIGVRGNNILFKPTVILPDTNMIVITNKRTYAFQITNARDDNLTYVARFNYPKESKADSSVRAESGNIPAINTVYYKRGDSSIMPTNVWDNGRFTYLKFANASDLPVVYRVMPDKTEALVNYHIDKDMVVLHEIGKLYRLRLGKSVADIANAVAANPVFNYDGTSEVDTVRTVRGKSND